MLLCGYVCIYIIHVGSGVFPKGLKIAKMGSGDLVTTLFSSTWFGNYTAEVKMDTHSPPSKRSKVTLTNIWTMP